jgi:hypothetical protein
MHAQEAGEETLAAIVPPILRERVTVMEGAACSRRSIYSGFSKIGCHTFVIGHTFVIAGLMAPSKRYQ